MVGGPNGFEVTAKPFDDRVTGAVVDDDGVLFVDGRAGRREVVASGQQRAAVDDYKLGVLQPVVITGGLARNEADFDASVAKLARARARLILAGVHRQAHGHAPLVSAQQRVSDLAHAEGELRDVD